MRTLSLGLAAGLFVAMMAPLTVLALSDEQECYDGGGVYENDHGTKSCTFSDPRGTTRAVS